MNRSGKEDEAKGKTSRQNALIRFLGKSRVDRREYHHILHGLQGIPHLVPINFNHITHPRRMLPFDLPRTWWYLGQVINHRANVLPSVVARIDVGTHLRLTWAGYPIHSTSSSREALAMACFIGISRTCSRWIVSVIYLHVNEISISGKGGGWVGTSD